MIILFPLEDWSDNPAVPPEPEYGEPDVYKCQEEHP